MTTKSSAAVLLLSLGLLACSPQVVQHGHTIEPANLARISPGQTSREEVARLLGSPSTIATFDEERWYYVSQRREIRSFYQNDITNQDVVTIVFDDRGVVTEVAQLDLDQAVDVEPSKDVTRTLGNELTIVEQLLGNIGRFGDPSSGGLPQRP